MAYSSEVNNAFLLIAAALGVALFGVRFIDRLSGVFTRWLGGMADVEVSVDGARPLALDAVGMAAGVVVPVIALVVLLGLAGSVGQTGWLFVVGKVKPRLEAISPVKGLKQIFSLSSLMRLVVAVAKIGMIGAIVYLLLSSKLGFLAALLGESTWGVVHAGKGLCLSLLIRVSIAMLVVAAIDFAYQRWQHEKKLMMTRAEMKQDRKRDEGSPEVKGRQARMRVEMVRARMMYAVPEATVVVTNPTHLAVALKWDEKGMGAPQVVAKGKGLVAERIKQIAMENGVPILERKPLAQALYEAVEIGMEIPPMLYYAVAEVLAFVMRKGPSAKRKR